MDTPQELIQVQLVLRSVVSICAVIGLSYAWYDYRYWKTTKQPEIMVQYVSHLPFFMLVCVSALLFAPVSFANLTGWFSLSPIQKDTLRCAALFVSGVYFYVSLVMRLRAYKLPARDAAKKAGAIFLAMILLTAVGFKAA